MPHGRWLARANSRAPVTANTEHVPRLPCETTPSPRFLSAGRRSTLVEWDGQGSLLDLTTGQWQDFHVQTDLGADVLTGIVAEQGEILVSSNLGAHRWLPSGRAWQFLGPKCTLVNPVLQAAVEVGDELWAGYTNQGFGMIGRQGISRFDERRQSWSYISPNEIGTACTGAGEMAPGVFRRGAFDGALGGSEVAGDPSRRPGEHANPDA